MTETISDLIHKLSIYDGRYEYDAVEYALDNRGEITPHLIELLSFTLRNAAKLSEDEEYMGHFYSIFLLAHFKEVSAHSMIIQLFSLPTDICDPLFGDVITEELPTLLLRTCGGDLGQIRSLAENKTAYEFCRSSALEAMVRGVAAGFISREEVLDFVSDILKSKPEGDSKELHDAAANAILDLSPEDEHLTLITNALEKGYIPSNSFGKDDIDASVELGPKGCLARIGLTLDRSWDENHFHRKISRWCYIDEESGDRSYEASLMDNICICRELAFPYGGRYQRESMDEALKRQDELTPFWLESVHNALDDASSMVSDQRFTGPVFAMVFLAHFKEVRAHKLFINVAQREKLLENAPIRDLFYRFLPAMLQRTSGGDISSLKELVLNDSATEYSRCAAIEALSIGAGCGDFNRIEVVGLLGQVLSNRASLNSTALVLTAMEELLHLYPEESKELIEEVLEEGGWHAFEDEVAFITEDLAQALKDGLDLCIEKHEKRSSTIWDENDIHKQTGWWDFPADLDYNASNYGPPKKTDKKKQKKLKKIQNASKKKNKKKKKKKR
jgi:hypothetical protein